MICQGCNVDLVRPIAGPDGRKAHYIAYWIMTAQMAKAGPFCSLCADRTTRQEDAKQ